MADRSDIGWTDETLNWLWGCDKTSAGCLNCYITRTVPFRVNGLTWNGDGIGASIPLQFFPARMAKPLAQARPRRIFVNSLGDTFHDDVPLHILALAFAYMALSPRHQYQVLTKRDRRLRITLNDPHFWVLVGRQARRIAREMADLTRPPVAYSETLADGSSVWDGALWEEPRALGNVLLGVSAENQQMLDRRGRALRRTPAAVRYISAEPLLEPIDVSAHLRPDGDLPGLDWVITGGETGTRAVARPIHPDWVRSIRDQCQAAGVPLFFKQWGSWATMWRPGDAWADRPVEAWIGTNGRVVPEVTPEIALEDPRVQWCSLWYAGLSSKPAGNSLDGETFEQHPRQLAVAA